MNLPEFGVAFDPIDILSSWNISQRQEAATRLAADSVAAKSGDCTKSKIGASSSSSSFPPQNNYMPYFGNNQFGVFGVMADHGSIGLFSNSRFPDCLWNIHTNNAVPSGESAIDAFKSKPIDANDNNNIDETVSNTSSYHPRDNMDKRSHNALLESDSLTRDYGFQLISGNDQPKSKKSRSEYKLPSSSNVKFQQASSSACSVDEPDAEAIAQMKEMIYCAAAFRPVSSVTEEVRKKPKRKNVRISTDPQTAAARRRRERISERIRALQKLVPGASNMDTASMLDEAANYLKFLRTQVNALEAFGFNIDPIIISNNFTSLSSIPFSHPFPMQPHFPLQNLNPIHRPKC